MNPPNINTDNIQCMSGTKIGFKTTAAFVVANMVGVGVFTSLGFQLAGLSNPLTIAFIWIIGGLTAFCGAIAYSELGATMPRSGGEYNYLSVIYHPALGFVSGWASLVVGFSAPVALTCMAMSSYLGNIFPQLNAKLFAMIVLTLITLIHAFDVRIGTRLQRFFTLLKIFIIVVFIVAGFIAEPGGAANFSGWSDFSLQEVFSPAFAISLVWVYYAYSGWNAAAYISGDVENPQRTVPRALLCGTAFVAVLYLFLNMVFLRTAPVSELTGQIEIGLICAKHIFGENGGEIMGLLITVMLISSISSMVFVGPRVGAAMGEDHRIFRFLTKKNDKGCPYVSVWVQWLVSAVMLLSGSFRAITQYTGVVLSFCALLSVVGVIVHRHRFPNASRPYRTWAYPWPIVFFAVVILWSVTYMLYMDFTDGDNVPWTAILSFATIFSGLILYWINKKICDK